MENNWDTIIVLSYYTISFAIVRVFCKRNRFIYFSLIAYLLFLLGAFLFVYLCGSYPPDCHYVFLLMYMLMIGEPTHHILLIIALAILLVKLIKKHKTKRGKNK